MQELLSELIKHQLNQPVQYVYLEYKYANFQIEGSFIGHKTVRELLGIYAQTQIQSNTKKIYFIKVSGLGLAVRCKK